MSDKSIHDVMPKIQKAVKAPKKNKNTFGKYLYRTVADILAVVKPVIGRENIYIVLSDELVYVGERVFVKATASLHLFEHGRCNTDSVSSTGFALHPLVQKGMSDSQLTGNASTYARKIALAGLFAIDDDAIDPDSEQFTDDKSITKKQVKQLNDMINKHGFNRARFLVYIGADKLESIRAERFVHALEMLNKQANKK